MHSLWETHPNDQDKSSLKLGGSTLQSLLDCPNLRTNSELLIILQGTRDLYLLCNFNCTQVMCNASDMSLNAQILINAYNG